MNFDEIKASVGESWAAYYNGLTQEQAFNLPVNAAVGQTRGVWYAGTEAEVPELAEFRIDL